MKTPSVIVLTIFLMLQTGNIYSQYCVPFQIEEIDFHAETRYVTVDAQWYAGWVEYHKGEGVWHKPKCVQCGIAMYLQEG